MSVFGKEMEFWDDDDCLVVPEQPPIKVYTNTVEAVVIRQLIGDDDVLVLIRRENVAAVARALLIEVGLEGLLVPGYPRGPFIADPRGGEYVDHGDASDHVNELHTVQPKDRTAAERQRRYRASRRNGPTVARNAETVTRLPFHEAAE